MISMIVNEITMPDHQILTLSSIVHYLDNTSLPGSVAEDAEDNDNDG